MKPLPNLLSELTGAIDSPTVSHLTQVRDVAQRRLAASNLERKFRQRLIGAPATGKYITFTPAIDQFLKGHLFGDIFGRDNLDFQSREIATISALANMEGVNPQLQSHFSIGFNVGLTEAQMRSLISVLEAKVGKKEAENAHEILRKVLSSRAK